MVIIQAVPEKNMDTETCPVCQKKLPIFTKEGKHNFCPASFPNRQIINICMECKMEEVVKTWEWQTL